VSESAFWFLLPGGHEEFHNPAVPAHGYLLAAPAILLENSRRTGLSVLLVRYVLGKIGRGRDSFQVIRSGRSLGVLGADGGVGVLLDRKGRGM
jgi:hypothetical protein